MLSCAGTFEGHDGWVYAAAQISPKHIATGGRDKILKIWNVEDFSNVASCEGHTDTITSCIKLANKDSVISDDCMAILATGSWDSKVCVWKCSESGDALGVECIAELEGHTSYVNCLVELNDSSVASGSHDCSIRVWKIEKDSFTCMFTIQQAHSQYVHSLCVYPANGDLISCSFDKTIKLWRKSNEGNEETVFEAPPLECVKTLRGHKGPVYSVYALKDGRIASAGHDHTIKVWNVDVAEAEDMSTCTLEGHSHYCWGVTQLPNSGNLASASFDKTVRIWELEDNSGKCISVLEGHEHYVNSVIPFAGEDGSEGVISACWDKNVKLWKA